MTAKKTHNDENFRNDVENFDKSMTERKKEKEIDRHLICIVCADMAQKLFHLFHTFAFKVMRVFLQSRSILWKLVLCQHLWKKKIACFLFELHKLRFYFEEFHHSSAFHCVYVQCSDKKTELY